MATNDEAIVTHKASDMILAVHSDMSYLSEPKARSRASGHFFMSTKTVFSLMNGAIHNTLQIN